MRVSWPGVVALVVVLLFVAFGYADKTRLHWVAEGSPAALQPAPDRVVGIEMRCDVQMDSTYRETWGRSCVDQFPTVAAGLVSDGSIGARDGPRFAINRRQVLTIRTSGGTSYTVAVPLSTVVKPGDEWPPK